MQKIDTMNKELLIRSSSNNVDFALLKDGKLIEFHKDNDNTKFLVGDIYLAKIRKTMPALNAAFVNVGYKKDAFLHYHDLGPKVATLQKFIKGVSSGKIKNYSLNNYKFEKK
jgi:ribonuclease G